VYQRSKPGFITQLKNLLEKNRLGELLVGNGLLTQEQLQLALVRQSATQTPLGKVLINEQYITRAALRRALIQQVGIRCVAAMLGLFITFSSFGGVKSARAASMQDIPAQMMLVSAANAAFQPMHSAYAPLFGSEEQRSTNLQPFTKWSGMFARFDATMNTPAGKALMMQWRHDLTPLENLPLPQMAQRVNDLVNQQRYINDNRNYGQNDYWATPIEFFTRGGDCEDFAIAKYAALRALGVPEERLRIAIVHDEEKNLPHAILVVYTDNSALILDNQSKAVLDSAFVTKYRPIFSINRTAWWLHSQPSSTVVASR
jgi:predicted transglutaminase-like cysteine proteinase